MDEYQLPLKLRAPFPTHAERAVAASDHPLASRAACKIVAQGGNAVDAAVALSFMLGVVCPHYTGIAGGGFAMVWMPGWPAPRWLDFREVACAAAHPETYYDMPVGSAWEGKYSVGVPGSIAGLAELHENFGSLPWADLIAPAIERAERGVLVDPNWARIAMLKQEAVARWPEASRIFMPKGRSPRQGDRIIQKDLARSYASLAREGPRGFYEGEVAASLLPSLEGWISARDLANYRVRWREPLTMPWDGGELYTVSSPSAGGMQLLQVLGLMERQGRCSTQGVRFHHRLAEAMRISFRERCEVGGDPDFGAPDPVPFVTPWWFDQWTPLLRDHSRLALSGPVLAYARGGTSSHVVATRDGGVVVMTESINHWFGSLLVPHGTGLVLNNIMDDFSTLPYRPDQFDLVPTALNEVQAGKRPLSSSTPTIWMQNGKPRLLVGSAGGPRITTSVAQILLHSRWNDCNIQQAVTAPRVHHQWHPDHLEVEPQVNSWLREELAELGHVTVERACRSHAAAVECHWDDHYFTGGWDFRAFGAARGL